MSRMSRTLVKIFMISFSYAHYMSLLGLFGIKSLQLFDKIRPDNNKNGNKEKHKSPVQFVEQKF